MAFNAEDVSASFCAKEIAVCELKGFRMSKVAAWATPRGPPSCSVSILAGGWLGFVTVGINHPLLPTLLRAKRGESQTRQLLLLCFYL